MCFLGFFFVFVLTIHIQDVGRPYQMGAFESVRLSYPVRIERAWENREVSSWPARKSPLAGTNKVRVRRQHSSFVRFRCKSLFSCTHLAVLYLLTFFFYCYKKARNSQKPAVTLLPKDWSRYVNHYSKALQGAVKNFKEKQKLSKIHYIWRLMYHKLLAKDGLGQVVQLHTCMYVLKFMLVVC